MGRFFCCCRSPIKQNGDRDFAGASGKSLIFGNTVNRPSVELCAGFFFFCFASHFEVIAGLLCDEYGSYGFSRLSLLFCLVLFVNICKCISMCLFVCLCVVVAHH